MKKVGGLILLIFTAANSNAVTLDLDQAIERALELDPRIREKGHLVDVAKGQLQEAEAGDDFRLSMDSFIGLSPNLAGDGVFIGDKCGASADCQFRSDRFELAEGVGPWYYLKGSFVKPFATFGKISSYKKAAKANIKIKDADVRLRRGQTINDVKRAYYGWLAANNGKLFLEDTLTRLEKARAQVEGWLESGKGKAKQSDLYAVQTAIDVINGMVARTQGLENTAMDGLRLLTGIQKTELLELADRRIKPVDLPELELAELQQKALVERPEILQVTQGLEARRALVDAEKAMARPNLFAGVAGFTSYSPARDVIDNPVISDPFNDYGITPVVGMQWSWEGGKHQAKTRQAKSELNALLEVSTLARAGIPFEVAEAYYQVHAYHGMVSSLRNAVRSARRWMISTLADFDAGIETSDKLVAAFQGYVLSNAEYLQAVYEYNMRVSQLNIVTGAYQ